MVSIVHALPHRLVCADSAQRKGCATGSSGTARKSFRYQNATSYRRSRKRLSESQENIHFVRCRRHVPSVLKMRARGLPRLSAAIDRTLLLRVAPGEKEGEKSKAA